MPVTVTWFDEAQTILLISGAKFTSAELSNAKPEITRLQQSVSHPIGIIQDMRHFSQVEPPRPGGTGGMSIIGDSVGSGGGRVVVIAYIYRADMVEEMNRMYSQMLTLMARMMPESSGVSVQVFGSVGAAADYIADVLNQSR